MGGLQRNSAAKVGRRGLIVGVLVGVALLNGCTEALTGGSIPTGGLITRASGVVVRADSPTTPLVGATLRFLPGTPTRVVTGGGGGGGTGGGTGGGSTGGGGGTGGSGGGSSDPAGTVSVRTDAAGAFSATGLATGALYVELTPPSGSGVLTSRYTLGFGSGTSYQLVLAPLPDTYNTALLTGVTCSPLQIRAQVGQAVPFELTMPSGFPSTLTPSLLLAGDCGTVSASGGFLGLAAGSGELHVVLGPRLWTVPVSVSNPF